MRRVNSRYSEEWEKGEEKGRGACGVVVGFAGCAKSVGMLASVVSK